MAATLSVTPNPIVVPYNGQVHVQASVTGVPPDETEQVTLNVGDAAVTVSLTVKASEFSWMTAVWSGLPTGVTAINNDGGSFTFKHAA